jgi:hypothetical protein
MPTPKELSDWASDASLTRVLDDLIFRNFNHQLHHEDRMMLDYELELGLDGEFESEYEMTDYEGEYESEAFLRRTLRRVAPAAIRAIGSLMSDSEYELDNDFEFEYEYEYEEAYPMAEYDVLMEQLGDAAANSESEAEAEAFVGALLPLAAKAAPAVAKALPKVAPTVLRGASRLASSLHRNPKARPLLRTVPQIMRGTVSSIAKQVASGQPINRQTAVRALASQAHRVLSNPKAAAATIRRSRQIQRRRPQPAR